MKPSKRQSESRTVLWCYELSPAEGEGTPGHCDPGLLGLRQQATVGLVFSTKDCFKKVLSVSILSQQFSQQDLTRIT